MKDSQEAFELIADSEIESIVEEDMKVVVVVVDGTAVLLDYICCTSLGFHNYCMVRNLYSCCCCCSTFGYTGCTAAVAEAVGSFVVAY